MNEEKRLAFRRGYVLLPVGTNPPPAVGSWNHERIGRIDAYLHPDLEWRRSLSEGVQVLVLGHIYDLDAPDNSSAVIANEIARRAGTAGLRHALDYIAYLGGRYVVVLVLATETVVVGDATGSRAAFSALRDREWAVASHGALAAMAFDREPDSTARDIVLNDKYISPGGKYYPALLTPFEGVRPVIANCYLSISLTGQTSHIRFYPRDELRPSVDFNVTYAEWWAQFSLSARLSAQHPEVGISLTAGLDSRMTLLALGERLAARGGFATTYHRFGGNSDAAVEDVVRANELAYSLRLPHRVVDVRTFDGLSSAEERAYAMTFPRGAQFPSRAVAYMRAMGGGERLLFSTVAEIGTVFYKERERSAIHPEWLSGKFSTSPIKNDPRVLGAFEEYIEYTQMSEETLRGIDVNDLFYWEHRNTKWAAVWYSECDLGHDVGLPFNNRRIIESMLSLPRPEREGKFLFSRRLNER
ncbi:hypothetical protein [Cellulosimicrobium cellulans]|uniref:hypothetical protein n=1 Tax=Cellulosimicrobium cellulans TaxID=1710 RepID=UPI001BA4BA5C|nr:hypothetical protein [Cellulosimicrobium cellulans]QUB99840.1 hypothetical protein J5A69_00480 [Cellulosimicrobium cellulans]